MAYCRKCGALIDDEAVICPKCGVPVSKSYNVKDVRDTVLPDSGGFGWGLLGFIFPIIGFILYLIWKDTKPKTARASGKGALWRIIITVLVVLIACIGIAAIG